MIVNSILGKKGFQSVYGNDIFKDFEIIGGVDCTMKKIMFYINAINGGGAARAMSNLSSQFADNGYDILFVTSYRSEGEYPLNEKIKRINLEEKKYSESRFKRNVGRIYKLRKICITERPDVLIAFMGEPNFRAVMATLGLRTKTVISVRNDPNIEYQGRLMNFVGKHILPLADGCVFQTEDAKAWFPHKLQKKSTIIFNAVKPVFYQIDRKPKTGVVVSCGRLQPQKNQKMLINAMYRIKDKYPFVRLKIYGEGILEGELKQLIFELNLQDTIRLEGQTSNVVDVLKYADIFALTSDFEGMPNALMEALAVGVPSISTDCPCGGPKMLIENGINGLLIPVGDEDALVNSIEKLLSDDVLKKNMSYIAQQRARQYTAVEIYNQWMAYLQRMKI